MVTNRTLHLHLDSVRVQRHAEGKAGVVNVISAAVETRGWRVETHIKPGDEAQPTDVGFHILYSQAILAPNCLNLRRCYRDPFFCLEPTNDRWDYEVAGRAFDAAEINTGFRGFAGYWRPRFIGEMQPRNDGYVLMPLQGKLLQRRHFQAMSPVDMIRTTLEVEPERPLIATLHPRETYAPEDLAALSEIAARNPRFRLSDATTRDLLERCDYVVTENSGVALSGFFAHKPAVLFAKIDFHHIAGSVPREGVDEAFKRALGPKPAFDKYLYWFLGKNAIVHWEKDAADRFVSRMRRVGWPI